MGSSSGRRSLHLTFLCNVAFATSWKPNHYDTDLGVLWLDALAISLSGHFGCVIGAQIVRYGIEEAWNRSTGSYNIGLARCLSRFEG